MQQLRATHIALLALALSTLAGPATADDPWRPFLEGGPARARPAGQEADHDRPLLPPMGEWAPPWTEPLPALSGWDEAGEPSTALERSDFPPIDSKTWAVERAELAPVITSDGAGLPKELWRGLDLVAVERLMARLEVPPRSPALHALWRRLLTSNATVPAGTGFDQFVAVRSEALYRSGLLREVTALVTPVASGRQSAIGMALKAKSDITLGNGEAGCVAAKLAANRNGQLPKLLRGEILVLSGYCAAAVGNAAAAGLAAELAREEEHDAPLALAALDAVALGQKPRIPLPRRLTPVQYRLLLVAGTVEWTAILERADPALLATLVYERNTDPSLRLAAAEAAARINVLEPAELAEIYRSQSLPPPAVAVSILPRPDSPLRRASLFQSIEREHSPLAKARAIRSFLDDAHRSGLYLHGLSLLAKAIEDMPRVAEIGWFAETAIESMLAAARYDSARAWTAFALALDGGRLEPGLQHWLALADIADPEIKTARGANLASVEELALKGRLDAHVLHRLATVLDALDYNVPIALWEIASRPPQPNNGHLPETGVLAELQDASQKREFGRTVLLTLHTLGPGDAESAHIIALGEAIRALKRAGHEGDARRLAFEALFASWPRLAHQ
jgi:hypothetical protein